MKIASITFYKVYQKQNTNFKSNLNSIHSQENLSNQFYDLFVNYSKPQKNSIFTLINTNFIDPLASKLFKNADAPLKIGVTGESGSGKSTFVANTKILLAQNHGVEVSGIYRDHYLKDYSEEAIKHGGTNNYTMTGMLETPDSIDFDRIMSDIKELEEGKVVLPKKRYRETGVVIEHDEKNPIFPSQFIFIEGISLFHNPEFKNGLDISIYADAPEEVIKERWFNRANSRGKQGDVAKQCYDVAKEMAQLYTISYRETSDLAFDTQADKSLLEKFLNDFIKIIQNNKKNTYLNKNS